MLVDDNLAPGVELGFLEKPLPELILGQVNMLHSVLVLTCYLSVNMRSCRFATIYVSKFGSRAA